MKEKVVLITLGCKQNKYESDCMARILEENGYTVSFEMEKADVYIINSCAVTKEAEKKSRQYIEKCNKLAVSPKIIVCGCASQNNIEQFKNKKNVISVFGTEGKEKILDYIKTSKFEKVDLPKNYQSICLPLKTVTRENLKIQDGCNNFCSYCLIPYLRGRSRSRNLNDILNEAEIIAKRSHEIVLTGIDISSFEVDGKPGLTILLKELKKLPVIITLGSLEVSVITKELLEVLSSMENFSPHFHLSLQSGDDRILKKMNRHYTQEEFYKKVKLIKKYFPLANLTTDIIVGFGLESEEEFENTSKFIQKCGFSFVHIFPYSKREGTYAYTFEDLPVSIKKERVEKLSKVNEKLKEKYLTSFTGKESIFLAEEKKEMWEGYDFRYIRCYSSCNLTAGKRYKIKFKEIYKDGMKVEILEEI